MDYQDCLQNCSHKYRLHESFLLLKSNQACPVLHNPYIHAGFLHNHSFIASQLSFSVLESEAMESTGFFAIYILSFICNLKRQKESRYTK